MYALAATAAGVGLLALAQLAEAKIIYTKTHHVIDDHNRYYYLDLNHDGKADFLLNVKANGRVITGTLTGYAYETIPNKPIVAGKTHGEGVVTLEPASLGALAAGRR